MSDQVMQVEHLSVKEILADDEWNARSGKYDDVDDKLNDGETGQGFSAFVNDIKLNGVESPIEVRHNTDKSTSRKQPYVLTAGFRRLKAAIHAGYVVIPCVIKDMSEAQARLRNIRENTDRENLKGADLAWGVAELFRVDPTKTETEVAMSLGLSQSYVGKLRHIMQDLPAKMTTAWRNGQVEIPVSRMHRLTAVTPEKLEEEFKKVVAGNTPAESAAATPNETAAGTLAPWLLKMGDAAWKLGYEVGVMQQLGAISEPTTDQEVWTNVVLATISYPKSKTLSAGDLKKVGKRLKAGIAEGLKASLAEEEEEEPEVKPARGRNATAEA